MSSVTNNINTTTQKTGPPKDLKKKTNESLLREAAGDLISSGKIKTKIAPLVIKIVSGLPGMEVLRLGEIAQMYPIVTNMAPA